MADQGGFNKPDGSSNYSSEVLQTLRANIRAALALTPASRFEPGAGAVRRSAPSANELLLEASNDDSGTSWATVFDSRNKVNKAGDTMTGSLSIAAGVGAKFEILDTGDSNRGGYIATTSSAIRLGSNSGVRAVEIAPDSTVAATFAVGGNVGIGGAVNLGFSNRLSVYGMAVFGNSSAPQVMVGNNGGGYGLVGTYGNHDMLFAVNNAGYMRLTTAGDLRLEASAPKLIHYTGSQSVSEIQFSTASSRGKVVMVTKDTSGANERAYLTVQGASTVLAASDATNASSVEIGTSLVSFRAQNQLRAYVGSSSLGPINDNAISCGASGERFTAVWAVNGTIQTSDLTDKTNVTLIDADLATRFVLGLKPLTYRWIVGGQHADAVEDGFDEREVEVEETYTEEIDEPIFDSVEIEEAEPRIEIRNGAAVQVMVAATRVQQVPVGKWFPMVDAGGNPVLQQNGMRKRTLGRGKKQRVIEEPNLEQVRHFVQDTRRVTVQRTRKVKRIERTPKYKTVLTPVPGKRTHAGFGAQDIKALMDRLGIDCGLWVLGEDGKQHMRPDQLIPFLAAALASALERIDKLEGGEDATATA